MAGPKAPTPVGDTLAIVGMELLLVGALGAATVWRLRPGVALAAYALVAAIFSWELKESASWFPRASIAALCLSFLPTIPGVFFFLEILRHMNRSGPFCYDLPMFSLSGFWILVGPVLLYVSARVSARRSRPAALVVFQILHAVAWLLGALNTMLCTATV